MFFFKIKYDRFYLNLYRFSRPFKKAHIYKKINYQITTILIFYGTLTVGFKPICLRHGNYTKMTKYINTIIWPAEYTEGISIKQSQEYTNNCSCLNIKKLTKIPIQITELKAIDMNPNCTYCKKNKKTRGKYLQSHLKKNRKETRIWVQATEWTDHQVSLYNNIRSVQS